MKTMFTAEKTKAELEICQQKAYQSDDKEKHSLQNIKNVWMAKKRSMLPKNNFVKSF